VGAGEDGDGGRAWVEGRDGEAVAEVPGEYCLGVGLCVQICESSRCDCGEGGDVGPLWPYLDGSEDAPATAKRGEEKKILRAASMSAERLCPRVWGMGRVGERPIHTRWECCDVVHVYV
jgi:hypothetical protein